MTERDYLEYAERRGQQIYQDGVCRGNIESQLSEEFPIGSVVAVRMPGPDFFLGTVRSYSVSVHSYESLTKGLVRNVNEKLIVDRIFPLEDGSCNSGFYPKTEDCKYLGEGYSKDTHSIFVDGNEYFL